MNPSKLLSLSMATLLGVVTTTASAQTTATSTPAGFVTIACPANSDTRIAPPLTRPPEFTGAVTNPLPGATNVVTVAGTPGWTANQFVYAAGTQPKTYYAIFGPASSAYAAEGKFFTVTANTSNTLTLDIGPDSLASVPVNAQIQLIPYWTFATLFPAADAGVSFVVSGSAINRQTEVLIPNHAAAGTNASPAFTYFFFNGAWRRFGQPVTTSFGDDVLPPAENIIVRNKATATNLTVLGGVEVKKVTAALSTVSNDKQDNFVSLVRPVDVAIRDLGLISSGAFVASTSAINRADELLVFDNTTAGINKSAASTYFFFNGAWRRFGQPVTTDFGGDIIPAGAGFVIRKAQTPGGTTAFWVNSPTYNP